MELEVERKFKLKASIETWLPKNGEYKKVKLHQAYVVEDGVKKRIRYIEDENRMVVTIKDLLRVTNGVPVRSEKEFDVSLEEGYKLFSQAKNIVSKERYTFLFVEPFYFEVDVFLNLKIPLTLAEVEMKESDIGLFDSLEKPVWLGEDVSTDPKYTNYALSEITHNALNNMFFKIKP